MPKAFFKKFYLVFILFGAALFNINSGCNKSLPPSPTPPSIAALINTGTNFTVLKAAMQKAGLETQLTNSGTFTFFAPTNNGFARKGITTATINTLSVAAVTELLKYHIINTQSYRQADLPIIATGINSMASVNNSLYLKLNNSLGIVNGIKFAQANVVANNGVLHVLDTVLTAPTQNIWSLCTTDTALKLFRQAVNKTVGSSTDFNALLNGSTAISIFAPTNNAFRAAMLDSTAIANETVANIINLLKYHTLNGRVFSAYFNNLELLATQNTTAVAQPRAYLDGSGDVFIRGNGNNATTQAKVMPASALPTNGVLHIVNNVIKL